MAAAMAHLGLDKKGAVQRWGSVRLQFGDQLPLAWLALVAVAISVAGSEKNSLFLQLDPLPRRIADDAIEAPCGACLTLRGSEFKSAASRSETDA